MSNHTTTPAAAVTSPKIKAGAWTGAALTILAAALTAGIAAIPKEAWEGLGIWGTPVGVFVGALGFGVAAYLKGDPLRNLGGAIEDMGGTTPPATAPEDESDHLPIEAPPTPAESPEGVAAPVDDDALTPEADALAARAAELRRTGSSTVGGGI